MRLLPPQSREHAKEAAAERPAIAPFTPLARNDLTLAEESADDG